MKLVIQSFGNEKEYRRAVFCILSFYLHTSKNKEIETFLFTDSQEFFSSYLHGIPIRYFLLDQEKIRFMRGEIDFLHRIKIAIIEKSFKESDGPILYADSDTFFIYDPSHFIKQVSENVSFMHVCEYRFDSLIKMKLPAGKSFHSFLNCINNTTFQLSSGKTLKVSDRAFSWNAGVMIFHPIHKKYIDDVYALTDQFYIQTGNHASEQYAFSVVLQNNTSIKPCNGINYHYWYRVKKNIMDLVLKDKLDSTFIKLDLNQKFLLISRLTKSLPKTFESHILMIRDNAIQAFHENLFLRGYRFAFFALMKNPWDRKFMMDILYHTKRFIRGDRN